MLLGLVVLLIYTEVKYLHLPGIAQPRCTPKINITFLKTHKTGSTSIQNILMRFGIKHGALFVLPPEDNILSSRRLFHQDMKWAANISSYNMLAHHTRLNYEAMKKLMPADSLFITIVRDPVSAFESMYSYYNMEDMYQVPIEQFKATSSIRLLKHRHLGYLGTNQMLFDMGFDGNDRDGTKLTRFIQELDQIFDLVLIAEHMSESLVLLKHMLCWTTDDVMSFRLNARKSRHPLSADAQRMIESVNWADQILYRHFVFKFNKLVDQFGRDMMKREVKELQARDRDIFARCVASASAGEKGIMEYSLKENSSQCWLMSRSEQKLTSVIRKQQNQRLDSGS